MTRKGVDPNGTEPLGLVIPDQRTVEKAGKPKPVPAAGYGSCPGCTKGRVAFVRQGAHLVWKIHNVITNGRSRPVCKASGQRVCETGEGTMPLHHSGITCVCGHIFKKER